MKAKNVPGLRWTEFFKNKNIYMFSVYPKNGKYISPSDGYDCVNYIGMHGTASVCTQYSMT